MRCVRMDNSDGSTMEVPVERAIENIRDNYVDVDPVIEEFRRGVAVRTKLATYRLMKSEATP